MRNRDIGLAVAALMLLCGVLLLQDQRAQPQVEVWLDAVAQRQQNAADSQAYRLGLGLDAPAGQDPVQWGEARLQAYREGKQMSEARLEVVQHPLLCSVMMADCRQRLQHLDVRQAQQLLQEQQLLRQRYLQMLQLQDFATALGPALDEPLPAYQVLLRGMQLQALAHRLQALAGQAEAVDQQLRAEIALARVHLERADNLISKMVWVRVVAQQVDTLADLYRLRLGGSAQPLAELNEQQLNLLPALQREFANVVSGIAALRSQLPWFSRIFYKPQHTQNLMLMNYQAVAERAALNAAAFSQSVSATPSHSVSFLERMSNYVGVLLAQTAMPDLNIYSARMHDLQGKVRLFNLLHQLPEGAALEPALLRALAGSGNPYEPEQPPRWEAARGQLCYQGPLVDKERVRCLNVADQASPGSSNER